MSTRNLIVISILAAVFAGCCAPAAKPGPAPAQTANLSWNHKPLADAPGDFHFAVVSDNSGGLRPGVFKDAVAKLNLMQPALVMSVGDLVEGYTENEAEYRAMYDEFSGEIGLLNAPFFGTVGNHDVEVSQMRTYVQQRYGQLYYSFVYNDVLFVVLNSQDGTADRPFLAGFSDRQVEFATKALADNAGVRWTFVFMHQPFFAGGEYKGVAGWDRIETALAGRPHTVFAGHWHEYAKHTVNGSAYYRLATTGGASSLSGAEKGEFDGIVWVTMTENGPVLANLDLKGIYPDDVATEQTSRARDSINNSSIVTASAITLEERLFAAGRTKLELKNDTDFPLAVKASIEASDSLIVEPSRVEASVKPHSTETVELALSVPQPAEFTGITPAVIKWSARYDVPGREPIEGAGKGAILIEGVHRCARATAPVAIDGNLSEWGTLGERFTAPMQFALRPELWTGPDDSSASFAAAYDDNFLYLAFAVTDDRIVVDGEHRPRQEDALSVYVDARTAATPKSMALITITVVSPGTAPGKESFGELLPEGMKVASVITPAGYNTEMAIPLTRLKESAQGDWKSFRLNMRLHDLDTPDWEVTTMWWRPAWDGPQNCPGAGTFVRE